MISDKMFDGLDKRSFTVLNANGETCEINILPVRLAAKYSELCKDIGITDAGSPKRQEKLMAFLASHSPDWMKETLSRMNLDELLTYGSLLVYGSRPAIGESPEKGNDGQKLMDYNFAVAKILRAFGGYTVQTLLEEPFPVFIKIFELSVRASADMALSEIIPSSCAAQGSKETLKALERKRGEVCVSVLPQKTDLTEADMKEAEALLSRDDLVVLKTVRAGEVYHG